MTIVSGPGRTADSPPIYIRVDDPPASGADGAAGVPPGAHDGVARVHDGVAGVAGVYEGIDTRGTPAARVMEIARDVYGDGLDLARRCAEQAATRFQGIAESARPDEIEVQLAIKLDASLGAILVQSAAEAQLQVTFRWKPGADS